MNRFIFPILALVLVAATDEPRPKQALILAPNEIVAGAPAADWVDIATADLLVMDLEADRAGNKRRVVIQLIPPPFSQRWIENIRKLAAMHWWDATSINRVQDNYVVQWGDATEKKPLPQGLATPPESDYTMTSPAALEMVVRKSSQNSLGTLTRPSRLHGRGAVLSERALNRDPYADDVLHWQGWPLAMSSAVPSAGHGKHRVWPVHCYGMVGVGRNLSPDTGTGAELYTVIGHAPRHLDQNIALVGRVISGIEQLSSLPRGTGALGFYEAPEQRVMITSIRLASDLPEAERPRYQYLSTESATFAKYADARANRHDAFFILPAGGADICNIPVPVRKKP